MDKTAQQAWYLWAKSDQHYKQDGRWLPLLTHLLDVAACAWEILELEPPKTRELFAQDYDLEPLAGQQLVCALVGLHDLGKASPTFQRLWDMAQKRPLAGVERLISTAAGQKVPHGQVSQLALPHLLELFGWPSAIALRVADAVGCHHGRRNQQAEVEQITDHDFGEDEWIEARFNLVEQVFLALRVYSENV